MRPVGSPTEAQEQLSNAAAMLMVSAVRSGMAHIDAALSVANALGLVMAHFTEDQRQACLDQVSHALEKHARRIGKARAA